MVLSNSKMENGVLRSLSWSGERCGRWTEFKKFCIEAMSGCVIVLN